MFSCVWHLCGWNDFRRMENKKTLFQSQGDSLQKNSNDTSKIETFVKYPQHSNVSSDRAHRIIPFEINQTNYLAVNSNVQNIQHDNQQKVYEANDNLPKHINVVRVPQQSYDYQYDKNISFNLHKPITQSSPANNNNIKIQNTSQIWIAQQFQSVPYQPQPIQNVKFINEKKKNSGFCQIKSPSLKRSHEAPVTKQGWLHKQGSEGLMLWKKRWFVLVEYCLFYYKGPEEEKLLGSILLPSYKVSICKPEEKVSKKFAFKCEHTNMRTYILATDSQEQMMHWVQVLNLATLMQNITVEMSKPLSSYNNSNQPQLINNYDSSEQYSKTHFAPPNTHSSSNSLLQDQCNYNQPLYANAPPKPKRLNDGFSSPSPDILERQNIQYNESKNISSKSSNNLHCKNFDFNMKHSTESLNEFQRISDIERRTPETYGRSTLDSRPTDYEDVYNDGGMYRRPVSPVAYNHVIKRNKLPYIYSGLRYNPLNMDKVEMNYHPTCNTMKDVRNITRPHSADFLEYELNHKFDHCTHVQQRPRPKSSMEINSSTNNDNDFYSKERYAEKMRKSAQYLKYTPSKYVPAQNDDNSIVFGYENVSPFQNFFSQSRTHQPQPQPIRSKSALSDATNIIEHLERNLISPDFSKQHKYKNQKYDYEQFTRSASARLPYQCEKIHQNAASEQRRIVHMDGERKREESMKRLLEWKQRMLQSPLNRKIQGNLSYRVKTDIFNNNNDNNTIYKLPKHQKYIDSSYMNHFYSKGSAQCNSYSSDDEENEKKVKKIVDCQAGRTSDTFANICESPTLAQSLSATLVITTDPVKSTCHRIIDDTSSYSNLVEHLLISSCTDGAPQSLSTFNKKDLDQLSNLSSELAEKISNATSNLRKNTSSVFSGSEANVTGEENYIPMSPTRTIAKLENNKCLNIEDDDSIKIDENHYVEMTRNAAGFFLSSNLVKKSNIHVFNDDIMEPLYVELRSPENNEDEFPHLRATSLHRKTGTKSDGSDADDEASKDLDSLDTLSQPRFSLSDTFRPASYYLGTCQINANLQDSSDRELISPLPPVPSSPPLSDDISSTNSNVRNKDDTKQDVIQLINEEDKNMVSHNHLENDLTSSININNNGVVVEQQNNLQEINVISNCDNNNKCSILVDEIFSSVSAPYYYSDLPINTIEYQKTFLTLNNQRSTLKCKRDITHIRNPIKCNSDDGSKEDTDGNATFKLASEARSVSADFLNLTDKNGHIDNKNIYESVTIQQASKKNCSDFEAINILRFKQNDKFTVPNDTSSTVRRTHSLEGLLENVLKVGSVSTNSLKIDEKVYVTSKSPENTSEGSYLWEEDSIWRERLRSASQRHTKSMEDLDTIGESEIKKKTKSPRGIIRGATYVNENFLKIDKQHFDVDESKIFKLSVNKIKKDGSFTLDREKLRQWDLMSSAPADNQVTGQVQDGNNVVVEISDGNFDSNEINTDQQTASGSISINTRDSSQLSTFPRTTSTMSTTQKSWIPSKVSSSAESSSLTNILPYKNMDKEFSSSNPRIFHSNHPNVISPIKGNWMETNNKVTVSAGELLGRTHEELVLLLIQLRRQSSQTLQAIENSCSEYDQIQAQLFTMDQSRRMENLQKLEQIKQHLLELEKRYEKGKPLVNLVDNMVKLGSLYRIPQERDNIVHHIKDKLEFNQRVQERRLLAEEKREWNKLNTNHIQLQEKVDQLYMLDRLIHEESGTLQNLQQDKEDIERALGCLRQRLNKGFKDPSEIELARKQQIMLENELIRVHFMLAQNSKKLEATVSGNAKLEHELMVLKQKLQNTNTKLHNPSQNSNTFDTNLICVPIKSCPELDSADMNTVEKKIDELQQQRQKLSLQVRQLTDRSRNLSHLKLISNDIVYSHNMNINKKRIHSLWRETDLDTMSIIDHGDCDDHFKVSPLSLTNNYRHENSDTTSNQSSIENNLFLSNSLQEKQEIKTVRIVKRESEKRQRDREKSISSDKWNPVREEDASLNNSNPFKIHSTVSLSQDVQTLANNSSDVCDFEKEKGKSNINKNEINLDDCAPNISHIFKSEAARQIITEMAIQQIPKQTNRRVVPKEKRRHYTAPHGQTILQHIQQLPTNIDPYINTRRARDDLDMERALRQRIDAPDVVRSTLINTELKYNEQTIDNLLGTPSKINIPERYIPEQVPQLSEEEQEYRLRKVEAIKKMLSDTTFVSTSCTNLTADGQDSTNCNTHTQSMKTITPTKIYDEKKQREHLLQLNQILAKQVMEMSQIVAEKATRRQSEKKDDTNTEEEDLSPLTPLPLYQQRNNFYS